MIVDTIEEAQECIHAWETEATPFRAARMLRYFAEGHDRIASINETYRCPEAAKNAREIARLFRYAATRIAPGCAE